MPDLDPVSKNLASPLCLKPRITRQSVTYVVTHRKIRKALSQLVWWASAPIEQPIKFDLVVNIKTAKALGITIPDVIMLRANRMIE